MPAVITTDGPPNETMPTPKKNFLAFVCTTLPTLPTPGSPHGEDLTNGLGQSLFKRRGRELGDNRVLGGIIKNIKLLAIRSTSLGWAI